MKRRGFLGACLAAGMAPAIARAGVLMPIYVAKPELVRLWGDGIHDDREALQQWINGATILGPDGKLLEPSRNGVLAMPPGKFLIADSPLVIGSEYHRVEGGYFVASKIRMPSSVFRYYAPTMPH